MSETTTNFKPLGLFMETENGWEPVLNLDTVEITTELPKTPPPEIELPKFTDHCDFTFTANWRRRSHANTQWFWRFVMGWKARGPVRKRTLTRVWLNWGRKKKS